MHVIALTVFAVTALLALISVLLPVAGRLNFPYAVLLAVVGCVIGLIGSALAGFHLGPLGDIIAALGDMRPTSEDLIYIFLPTLLFETALSIDVRRLLDEMGPVLLLAVVAVVVSTGVVGLMVWWASSEPLLICLMLGAVLATTDPVAVVAIFRDIGAPRRLSILVEGESLFNDAAAIALFTLLIGMFAGYTATGPASAVVQFFLSFSGGLVVGGALAWAACALLTPLRELQLAQTTLTISLAYIAFVLGEEYLHVSGVVACVAAGLVVNYRGRRQLAPSSWVAIVSTWETLGFWASSLIFLLATMLVPSLIGKAGWAQAGLLAVVVIAAFLARTLTLFGLLPFLTAIGWGQRVSNPYKTVIVWGGLRGAVSLALAVAARENESLPEASRIFLGQLATGFVLFTLFVNAPTLRPLMRVLGLDKLSAKDVALRNRVMQLGAEQIEGQIARIAEENKFDPATVESINAEYRTRVEEVLGQKGVAPSLPEDDAIRTGLVMLADHERELYGSFVEGRVLSPDIASTLQSQASRYLENARTQGRNGYRQAVRQNLRFSRSFRLALLLQRYFGIVGPLARELGSRSQVLFVQGSMLRQLRSFSEGRVKPLLGETVGAVLLEVLGRREKAVDQAIRALRLQYPKYALALQTRYLALAALRLEEDSYRQMMHESIVTSEVFNDLMRELRARRRQADHREQLDLGLKREALVCRVEMFSALDPERLRRISRMMRPQLVVPGEMLVRKGERGDHMFFISSGAVEVRVEPEPVRLGTGDFFGEIALLTQQPRNADVVALSYCQMLRLSRRDFAALLNDDPALRGAIASIAESRVAESQA